MSIIVQIHHITSIIAQYSLVLVEGQTGPRRGQRQNPGEGLGGSRRVLTLGRAQQP